jgi:hypothetical protein
MITGIIVWQRNRRETRMQMMEAIRPADLELTRVEQLFADPQVSAEACRIAASEALQTYQGVLRDGGQESPELDLGMARCFELMGQDADAEFHYLKAGRSPSAKLGLGRVCLRRFLEGRKDKDWRREAVGPLEGIGRSKAVDAAALLLDFSAGRVAEVVEAAPRVLEVTRHDDVVQMVAGVAAVERGQWVDAIIRFEKAARLRRSDCVSLYWQGVAQVGMGDGPGAVGFLQEAIRTAPPDWPLRPDAERRLEEARR